VGVKRSAAVMFVRRFMKDGLLERKKVRKGHTSVNADEIKYITSTPTLERYRHMSLDERVHQLNVDKSIKVSKTVLWTIYKEN
jgi:transposase